VEALQQPGHIDDVRCHELARALAVFFDGGWVVVDGKYGSVDHSWLVPLAYKTRTVLDPYAVWRVPMVQLVDTSPLLPEHGLYKPGTYRMDIQNGVVTKLIQFFGELGSSGQDRPGA
jgi:hypothetical protein